MPNSPKIPMTTTPAYTEHTIRNRLITIFAAGFLLAVLVGLFSRNGVELLAGLIVIGLSLIAGLLYYLPYGFDAHGQQQSVAEE